MFKVFTHSFVCAALLVSSCVAMESGRVDITDLDKVVVVRVLWQKSIVAKTTAMKVPYLAAKMSVSDEEIHRALAIERGYIDYLKGAPIKADLSKDSFDPYYYNRNAGDGAAQKVIAALRKS